LGAKALRALAILVFAATIAVIQAASTAQAAQLPVQSSFSRNDNIVEPAGLSERKAATKAWFKRKGQQTSNWFQRQKRKLENLVN
jgi:hypothetical protein